MPGFFSITRTNTVSRTQNSRSDLPTPIATQRRSIDSANAEEKAICRIEEDKNREAQLLSPKYSAWALKALVAEAYTGYCATKSSRELERAVELKIVPLYDDIDLLTELAGRKIATAPEQSCEILTKTKEQIAKLSLFNPESKNCYFKDSTPPPTAGQ